MSDIENYMGYDDAVIQDTHPVPYYREFKNTTRKVVHLWEPLARYRLVKEKPIAGSPMPLEAVRKEVVERQGLNVTLKTSSGSYQEVRIPCTDELWDNIMQNRIWKFIDDDIYLKFDANGTAYEYVVNGKTDSDPSAEYSEEVKNLSRVLHVRDVLNAKKQSYQAEANDQWMDNTMIFELGSAADGQKPSASLKLKPQSISNELAQEALTALNAALNEGQIEKMDIIGDKFIIQKLKGKYIDLAVLK